MAAASGLSTPVRCTSCGQFCPQGPVPQPTMSSSLPSMSPPNPGFHMPSHSSSSSHSQPQHGGHSSLLQAHQNPHVSLSLSYLYPRLSLPPCCLSPTLSLPFSLSQTLPLSYTCYFPAPSLTHCTAILWRSLPGLSHIIGLLESPSFHKSYLKAVRLLSCLSVCPSHYYLLTFLCRSRRIDSPNLHCQAAGREAAVKSLPPCTVKQTGGYCIRADI